MIVVSSDTIPGYRITKCLGIARGNAVRARNVFHDIMAVFKNIIGGEISDYTKMMAESREQALDRVIQDAVEKGANGIVTLRFTSAEIMKGAAELLAYGTAVLVDEIPDKSQG